MNLRNVIFITCLILIFTACKKSDDSTEDYARYIVGTYKGFVTPGQVNGSVVIFRQSNTKVNIDLSIVGGNTYHYFDVTVGDYGSGTIMISLTTNNNTISGNVNVTTLDCYFNQLHFIGTEQ